MKLRKIQHIHHELDYCLSPTSTVNWWTPKASLWCESYPNWYALFLVIFILVREIVCKIEHTRKWSNNSSIMIDIIVLTQNPSIIITTWASWIFHYFMVLMAQEKREGIGKCWKSSLAFHPFSSWKYYAVAESLRTTFESSS